MPRKISTVKRVTLHKLIDGVAPKEAFREEYQTASDTIKITDVEIETLSARVVQGHRTSRPKWADDVTILTGVEVTAMNQSPGAVIAIQSHLDPVCCWALSWGTGFHFLNQDNVDVGFGIRVIARSAIVSQVKSLTKTVLDHRSRIDRSSIPTGSTISNYGVDGFGEAVSRVEAKARIAGLTVGDEKAILLRATDSLNLPLGKKASNLISDLEILRELLDNDVIAGLEHIEQLSALRSSDPRVGTLENKLARAIKKAADSKSLSVTWPHERLNINGVAESFKVSGFGNRTSAVLDEAPTVKDVVAWTRGLKKSEILDRINKLTITVHNETEPSATSAISQGVPLRRWIAFEVRENAQRFCLHDGRWYEMDEAYAERIDDRVREILARSATISLPSWPKSEVEKDYNIRTARIHGGHVIDRKLIKTDLHASGGIEPCDIYFEPGVLIHVKRGKSSSELSHLLAQALVSTDTIARDSSGREAWLTRLKEEGVQQPTADLKELIVAIGRKKSITVNNLFTFTKVNLVKQDGALRALGIDVALVTIPE